MKQYPSYKRIKESGFYRSSFAVFIRKCVAHRVGRWGAALAYYFLLSFFPLVLFISLLFSILSGSADITRLFSNRVVPSEVIDTAASVLEHGSGLGRETLMVSGALMSLYGGSRAVGCLREAINRSYGLREKRSFFLLIVIDFGFSALFLSASVVTFAFIILTPDAPYYIGGIFTGIRPYLRFSFVFLIFFGLLTVLYSAVPDSFISFRQAVPGALAAASGWTAGSMAFSLYVGNMGNYSILYGSIGAVIVLMLWLYFTGTVLVIGAEFNNFAAHFITRRRQRRKAGK